ncbi:MAG: GNAT family N-acetyltransferase [Chloroflexota bacterium]|nr:MAG: GNAT family N-acetyltransferase [Chloroflexota bacterium]
MSGTPTELSFRIFTRDDQVRVRQLILSGLGDHFGQIDTELNRDLDDINETYIVRGHIFVVGEIEDAVVAVGGLVELQEDLGRIVRVSVAKRYRRQGFGQAIVEYLLEVARQNGYRRLLVETNHDWTAAIALYQRCGFREFDRDTESIHMRLDWTDWQSQGARTSG